MAWSKEKRIVTMLCIDTVFLLVELGGGIYAHSLALQADAFHMVGRCLSGAILMLALTWTAQRHYLTGDRILGGQGGGQGHDGQVHLRREWLGSTSGLNAANSSSGCGPRCWAPFLTRCF